MYCSNILENEIALTGKCKNLNTHECIPGYRIVLTVKTICKTQHKLLTFTLHENVQPRSYSLRLVE